VDQTRGCSIKTVVKVSLLLNFQQGFNGPMVGNINRIGFYLVDSEIFHRKMLIDKYEVDE
jgi:FtsZ-interacting cell division protein ZipA